MGGDKLSHYHLAEPQSRKARGLRILFQIDIAVISFSSSLKVPVWFHLMLAGTQESEALLFLSRPLLRSERLLHTTASPSSNIR